ncbi:glycosyltransferase family 39 protein [Haloarcula sp. JP-L23]|uniref:glycosyltransferase family 39 protein n=1 Tax=Haloarcula sp. JP-L23 TaxID=2716717 RepID=UPI00140EA31E|nr:phospholipid carrier-dependent glycosyltransferase [Haloarcula sp. JP-L23]
MSTQRDLVAVFLLGLPLRLHNFTLGSVTWDPIWSVYYSTPRHLISLLTHPWNEPHPPLYYIVLAVSRLLFGTSEISVRLPSLLAGVVVPPMVYLLGKELEGRQAGLISGVLAAVMPILVTFSQITRMYSQLAAFGTLSMLCFVQLYRQGWASSRAAAYVVASLGALHTMVFGGFVIMAQALIVAAGLLGYIEAPSDEKLHQWGLLGCVLILGTVPIAAALYIRTQMGGGAGPSPPPSILQFEVLLNSWVGHSAYVTATGSLALLGDFTTVVVFLIIIVSGILLLFDSWQLRIDLSTWLPILWLTTTVVTLFGVSIVMRNFTSQRFFIGVAAAVALGLGIGIARFDRPSIRGIAVVLLVAAMVTTSVGSVSSVATPDWKSGVTYLDSHAAEGATVFTDTVTTPNEVTFYSDREDYAVRYIERNEPRLRQAANTSSEVWVIGQSARAKWAIEFYNSKEQRRYAADIDGIYVAGYMTNQESDLDSGDDLVYRTHTSGLCRQDNYTGYYEISD